MKKISALLGLGISLWALSADAAVTVRYYNRDSKKYTFDATCSGSKSPVTFDGSTTSSATIQGSGPCTVEGVTLKGGENIEIKDGKIIVK
jgi:hypothetical protein